SIHPAPAAVSIRSVPPDRSPFVAERTVVLNAAQYPIRRLRVLSNVLELRDAKTRVERRPAHSPIGRSEDTAIGARVDHVWISSTEGNAVLVRMDRVAGTLRGK